MRQRSGKLTRAEMLSYRIAMRAMIYRLAGGYTPEQTVAALADDFPEVREVLEEAA